MGAKEAKYTVTLGTTDLIANEDFFGKEHGPYTGICVLGFSNNGAQQILHHVNIAEIAAAIAGSDELRMAAKLALSVLDK